MEDYFAHIADDGRKQTVEEHLKQTARYSEHFASSFDASEFGRLCGFSHDIGKMSDGFQKRLEGGPVVDHATAGAILLGKEGNVECSVAVISHHSGLPDYGNERTDMPDTPTFCGRIKKNIENKTLDKLHWTGTLPKAPSAPSFENDFDRALWIRMLFSCLVDADYLDTEAFMQNGTVNRSGYDDLQALNSRLDEYVSGFGTPTTELNRMRTEIRLACERSAELPKGLYTLSVPTGGGKTLTSMSFALKHALYHKMRGIIYVVPYTSIIEQNAAVFKNILGSTNVLEHYSASEAMSSESPTEEEYRQILASENWDIPVVVTTSVQFFESLYSNRSTKCRKLHSIANSVIIFDEAQMIPSEHLLPCVKLIAGLVKKYNVTAVLCTATQPFVDDLLKSEGVDAKELCPEPEKYYDAFCRVRYQSLGKTTKEKLLARLSIEDQVLCIVNSRSSAQELFDGLPEEGRYHLSTLMCPSHRKNVLNEIRVRLSEKLPCRVISTSLIEAGVDVDFPSVYREMSGLDSILQAGGRCNREGKRDPEKSIVTIFEGVSQTPFLLRTNIGAAHEALKKWKDPSYPEAVRHYFVTYRDLIGDSIDRTKTVKKLERGIAGCRLPFKRVAEGFHLINDETKTIYIPSDQNFSVIWRIRNGIAGRADYRAAGLDAVQVYPWQFELLRQLGAVDLVDEMIGILVDKSCYSEEKGLTIPDSAVKLGEAFFV